MAKHTWNVMSLRASIAILCFALAACTTAAAASTASPLTAGFLDKQCAVPTLLRRYKTGVFIGLNGQLQQDKGLQLFDSGKPLSRVVVFYSYQQKAVVSLEAIYGNGNTAEIGSQPAMIEGKTLEIPSCQFITRIRYRLKANKQIEFLQLYVNSKTSLTVGSSAGGYKEIKGELLAAITGSVVRETGYSGKGRRLSWAPYTLASLTFYWGKKSTPPKHSPAHSPPHHSPPKHSPPKHSPPKSPVIPVPPKSPAPSTSPNPIYVTPGPQKSKFESQITKPNSSVKAAKPSVDPKHTTKKTQPPKHTTKKADPLKHTTKKAEPIKTTTKKAEPTKKKQPTKKTVVKKVTTTKKTTLENKQHHG